MPEGTFSDGKAKFSAIKRNKHFSLFGAEVIWETVFLSCLNAFRSYERL